LDTLLLSFTPQTTCAFSEAMPMQQTSLRGAPAAGPAASDGRASSYQIRASVLDAALAIGLNDASVNSWLYRPEDHDELLEDVERDLEVCLR
jgi:hypothetical protein